MISLDNSQISKSNTKSSLSLEKTNDESSLSFSELLKGIKLKGDSKNIQNGVLSLNLEEKKMDLKDEPTLLKNNALLSLLKNDDKELSTKDLLKLENLEINPKMLESISEKLTVKEVKSLIFEAKQYLKSKILQTEAFKKSETKELPKTLKGLVSIADKYGVNLSKITIEEIRTQNSKVNTFSNINSNVLDAKDNGKETSVKDIDIKALKIVENSEEKRSIKENRIIEKQIELPKEILKQPIFQEKQKTEFSTAELIQAREIKEFKVETKTPKSRADETLRLLLSGNKTEKSSSLISDISVASAKVIMPEMKNEITKGLESLLHIEPSETNTKTDNLMSTHKIDSLEVKLNEAKQMIKYLSQDVKTAIEDYKSPFTRIKVQLNPKNLGEIDLTVIQRGKNLIVNLSSNNSAVNTLAMNANELRMQLNNTGINNATLNFNNNGQSEQQSSSQHQQDRQHERRQAEKEYNYFYNEEQNEEVLSSLEIVVPNYA